MRNSQHFVSFRTYALAFAVALSPALLQNPVTCDRGNIDLTSLQFEVGGQDLVQGFEPAFRRYDVSTDGSAAVATLRATPAAGNSDVSWQWWVRGVMVDSGPIGIGGGEVPLLDIPPEGLSQLRVLVEAAAPSARRGYYQVNLSRQDVFACTEQGILDAIAMGGGPHTFDCAGPTTVATTATLVIDNDVILDGEGNLTVDSSTTGVVFGVSPGVSAELHGLSVVGHFSCQPPRPSCPAPCNCTGNFYGIFNEGALTVADSAVTGCAAGIQSVQDTTLVVTNGVVSDNGIGITSFIGATTTVTNSTVANNEAAGILAAGLTITDSTVSGNGNEGNPQAGIVCAGGGDTAIVTNTTVSGNVGHGIELGGGTLLMTNSTVSSNSDVGLLSVSGANLTVTNSTLSNNFAEDIVHVAGGSLTVANTIVDGDCVVTGVLASLGYNIESPGNTCGFNQATDLINVSDVGLGPLQDNGGPTETHALLPGSVAIDHIPEADCAITTDQRGVARPQGTACDAGAFELEQ